MSDDVSKHPAQRIIRDKSFAKRMEVACENHPRAPSGHGRQKWVREQMAEVFHVKVSPEAVRKWFAGEARPRPKVMSQIARILEVDEAWLSLGIKPKSPPREQRKQNATAAGAVNLVAAMIQLSGGNIAFPEQDGPDLFAIVHGKQHNITVRIAEPQDKLTLSVPVNPNTLIAVLPTDRPTVYRFFRIPAETVERFGSNRGGYSELEIERRSNGVFVGEERLPEIHAFDNLEGSSNNSSAGYLHA
ncbi:transcriptional regulator protein [Rhizobium phage RHph_X2_30]|nr:transcriptional regulator protein [Rhizobium phage RHph_X2_30]